MNNDLKYKIHYFQNKNTEIETHIELEYKGQKKMFYSGLMTSQEIYQTYLSGLFPIDIFQYPVQRRYNFRIEWIEMLLYNFQIKSIIEPELDYLFFIEEKIINDINLLSGYSSYNTNISLFLYDKYSFLYDENDTDTPFPEYKDYSHYHRLLDCFIQYQFTNQLILMKGNYNIQELFTNVNAYINHNYIFNLKDEFKEFVEWSHKNNYDIFNNYDIYKILNDEKNI